MPDRDKWIRGKGQSLSTGLYKDISAATQGNKRHTTEPVDWPWSKELKRKYGKNMAFNKPLPESDDVNALIARMDKERKDRETRYKRDVKLGTEWKTRNLGWFVVLPDASNPGKVRLQNFDEDGFTGHTTFDNIKKLVEYLIQWETTLTKAKGTLDKFSKTPRWKRGMERLLAFQKNEVTMSFSDPKTPEEKRELQVNKRRVDKSYDELLSRIQRFVGGTDENQGTNSNGCTGVDDSRVALQHHVSEVKTTRTALDLIEQVIQGERPSELIEKVSYAYDIRLGQNIHTGPVHVGACGLFYKSNARNYATEYMCEARKKRTPFYQMGQDAFGTHSTPAPYGNKDVYKKISALKTDKQRHKAMKDYADGWNQANLNSGVSMAYDRSVMGGYGGSAAPKDEYVLRHREKYVITGKTKSDKEYYGDKKVYLLWRIGDYDDYQGARNYQFQDLKTKQKKWMYYPSKNFTLRPFSKKADKLGVTYNEARKKRMPKAAADLLRSASLYPPVQIKFLPKAQAKYVDELIKRGWLEKTGPKYQLALKRTEAGREAWMKNEW